MDLLDILAATIQGGFPTLYVPSSRLLTFADRLGGVLENTNLGNTIITVPTLAQLVASQTQVPPVAYSRNQNNPFELAVSFARGAVNPAGTPGPFFVNPAFFRGTVSSVAAMTAPNGAMLLAGPGDVCVRSDLSNQRFYLKSGGVYTNAADWVSVPLNSPNNPPLISRLTGAPLTAGQPAVAIDWGDKSMFDIQYFPNGYPPVTLKTNGIDSWQGW